MAKKTPKLNLVLLAQIVAATQANAFVYVPDTESAPLVAAGLVEVNPAMADPSGAKATRATQAGIERSATSAPVAVPKTPMEPFVLEDAIPIPESKRGVRTESVYPFDKMAVGQSFFVAATAERPNPAKVLASTVSGATRRYAIESTTETMVTRKGNVVPKLEYTRKFEIRSAEGGARIWRTA